MDNPYFSVVIPVYNSEDSLIPLTKQLDSVFQKLNKTYEIVFVNDASQDKSLKVLRELASTYSNVIVIDLFRNYGQQNALMCGFNYCTGDFFITMDDDLQHDPEDIPIFYQKIQEGYDVVIGNYLSKHHNLIKNAGSYIMRFLNKRIFHITNKNLRFSSYRMIRREVIDQIKGERTNYPYISGLLVSTTSKVVNIDVNHRARIYGESSYSITSLIKLAFNLLINYSSIPLKIVGYLGLFVSLFSICFGGYFIIRKLIVGTMPPGFTTLFVLISFYNAMIFIFLYFLSEYISRILKESSQSKQYVVREVIK